MMWCCRLGLLAFVDWTCCLWSFRWPFAVSILSVQYCLTQALVRPGKLVNHPLSIAWIHVLMGGAPRVMW